MKSKIFQEILDETPKDVEIFVRLYADIVLRVNLLLKEKGLTQRALAEKLDKSPSEIHKWLSGDHNFTLRSLAKLEAELGEKLLEVPQVPTQSKFISSGTKSKLKVYVNKEAPTLHQTVWRYEVDVVNELKLEYANAS